MAKKVGRPSKYTPQIIEEVCERLSRGEPLAQICRDGDMPCPRTIQKWMKEDEAINSQVAHAREVGFDAIAAKCLDIADDNTQDVEKVEIAEGVTVDRVNHDVVQRAKLRIDTRLKLLACWDPKRYGTNLKLSGDKDNPLEMVVDLTKAL